jgi:alkylated DNA repair protein (DNA oxidative demethylase)
VTIVRSAAIGDIFAGAAPSEAVERLAEGAVLLRGFARPDAETLVEEVGVIAAASPFRQMITPGGFRMSVAMTNCGAAGWVTDRSGYRYSREDPVSEQAWPAMPPLFQRLAARAAAAGGFDRFNPDACLINRYEPGTKLSLHRDEDERDLSAPVVSVSLGLPAVFLWGGLSRKDRPARLQLENGDVVVWGGPARLVYHGIAALAGGEHPLTGPSRVNLTFRKAL